MKEVIKIGIAAVLLCPAWAAEPVVDAKAAFERIKATVGEWHAKTAAGSASLKVEVIAGGNSVMRRETVGGMEEMVTMIHLDGERLLLTHYCMAGNQPRLEARRYDAKSGVLRFEFLDGTNMKPTDGHIHNATVRFVGGDVLREDWEFFDKGKRATTETFDYHRVDAAKAVVVEKHEMRH